MSIGRLNWVLSANTSGFTRAVVGSRTDATLLKKALAEIKNPLDDWNQAQTRLTKVLETAKLADDQKAAILARLNAQHPEAIANTRKLADTEREAAAIVARHRTERERYAEAVTRLAGLKAAGQFQGNQGAYTAELERLKQILPEVRAQQDAAAAAQRRASEGEREAAAIVARHRTEREKYSEAVKRLAELKTAGNFKGNEGAYAAELERLKQTLPEVRARQEAAAATQQRASEGEREAAAIVARHRTEREKYSEAVKRLAELKTAGNFKGNEGAYAAELERLKQTLPEVRARQEAAAEAERKRNEQAQRAKALIDALNPSESQYRQGMLEAHRLRQQQLLTEDQFIARKKQLREAMLAEQMAQAKTLRASVASPTKDYQERLVDLGKMRQAGLLSGREFAQGHMQALAQHVQNIPLPGMGAVGGAMKWAGSTHPAMMGMEALSVSIKAAAAAWGVYLAAGAAVLHQMKGQTEEIKRLSGEATKLGFGNREFVALDRAARMSGVGTEQLAGAMDKLQIQIGQAQFGMPKAQAVFRGLGLDWERLARQSPANMLSDVQRALAGVPSKTEQAALASRLFGEDVRALLPLLTGARGSMGDWMKDAEQARLTFSDFDAKSIKDMYRAWKEVGDAIDGIFRRVTIMVGQGSLTELAHDIRDALQGATGDKAILYLFYAISDAAVAANLAVQGFRGALLVVNQQVAVIEISVREVYAGVLKVREGLATLRGDRKGQLDIANELKANERAIQTALMTMGPPAETAGKKAGEAFRKGFADGVGTVSHRDGRPPGTQAAAPGSLDHTAPGIPVNPAGSLTPMSKAQQDLQEKVEKLTSHLKEQYDALVENSGAAKIAQTAAEGASAAQLAEAKAWNQKLEAQKLVHEREKKLKDATREMADELRRMIATFGESSEAAKLFELRQLGATKATLDLLTAAKNLHQEQQLQKAAQDKGVDNQFRQWQLAREQQLYQQQVRTGRPGALDPKEQAEAETAELRRQYETQQMIARLKREGTADPDIRRQVALKEQANAVERSNWLLARRQKLFEEGRQVAESVRNPEEVYADRIRHLQEVLDAGGMSWEAYRRARQRASQDMGQAMMRGDRRPGVEAVQSGTAAAADTIWQLQRNMAAQRKAAEMDAQVAQERAARRQRGQPEEHPEQRQAAAENQWRTEQLKKLDEINAKLGVLIKDSTVVQVAGTSG